MARAPSATLKKKDEKPAKARSSASGVKQEQAKAKHGSKSVKEVAVKPKANAVNEAPVSSAKSVLKESRPVPTLNLVQEQDFPRGAAPPVKAPKTAKVAVAEDKGLFDDGLEKASKSDAATKTKRRQADIDTESEQVISTGAKKRKVDKKVVSKKASATPVKQGTSASAQETFRVEHLSYKRLLPGPTVLLVQVIAILPLELLVSLPGQLLGHIPITSISSSFTSRLEQELAEDTDEEEEEDSDDSDDEDEATSDKVPALDRMFRVGQYLRASVINVFSAKGVSVGLAASGGHKQRGNEEWRASRRCELSLEPSKVNAGVSAADLAAGGVILQASVKSIEDNGYVLDFGIVTNKDTSDKTSLTSFLSFEDAKQGKVGQQLPARATTLGGVITAKVTKVAGNGRTCNVSVRQSDVLAAKASKSIGITALLPGTLVDALVVAVTPSGLNVRFLESFEGTVDNLHMLPPQAHVYKIGDKVKARILWTAPPLNDSPIRFSLSVLPHILSLELRKAPTAPGLPAADEAPIDQVLPVGTFLEELQIIKVEPEWGVLCGLAGTDLKAFVHISHVSDEHITSLSTHASSGSWKVGSIHKGRVIGYSALDGLLQASFQQSVLERRFMKVHDLKVGDKLDGTVQRLADAALFVNIHGSVAGVVWPLHYSDLRLKHPERRFKPGTKVKARVLSLDAEKNRVVLTLKRSLVDSTLPVYAKFEDVKHGHIVNAMVQTFLNKDMLVELFGGLRAFVPVSEAADHFVEDIQKEFNLGQVVKIRITYVDNDARRLTASIKQALDSYKAPVKDKKVKANVFKCSSDLSQAAVGDQTSGTITAVHGSQVVLALTGSNLKALLSISALARHRKVLPDEIKLSLEVGQELADLAIVSLNVEKALVIVGLTRPKPTESLVKERSGISFLTEQPLLTFDSLEKGQALEGSIGDRNSVGYFVQLSRGIRAKLRWSEISDDYDELKSIILSKGSKVSCIIIEYDKEEKHIDVSLRRSRMQPAAGDLVVRDPILQDIEGLAKDQPVRGIVKSVSDSGVFVDLGTALTARVQIREMFDEYVKDWKSKFAVGQVVDGKILSTNVAKNQIEMTLRKTSSSKKTAKDSGSQISFEGLSIGEVVKGVIKRIENYGVFVRIDGSSVSGLCHKSQVIDEKNGDWKASLSVGDRVRAAIIELDQDKQKISFSLKPSKVQSASDSDSDVEDMERLNKLVEARATGSEVEDSDDEADFEDDDDEEDDEEEDDEEDDDDDLKITMYGDEDDEEPGDADGMSEDEAPQDQSNGLDRSTVQAANAGPAVLKLGDFRWDGQAAATNGDEDEASASDVDDDDTVEQPTRSKDVLIDDKTGDLDERIPTSPSDFDRLLLASPSSSLLWIQYMSYYLQLGDLDQARQTSQRALKTINYREEEERLNVWVARLNLESLQGTEESFEQVFNKAIQTNDAKQVFLRTTDGLDQAGKIDMAEDIYRRFVKKYNMSSKAWTLYGQFLLKHGKSNAARELLPRSLKSLPKRKQVKTISQFGLAEFKIGEPERARTIFEGIVDSYPKRLDLWWIYIDQEIRLRNILGVRALFDRVLATNLSSKKTKSVFKKWLAFEKQHGDEAAAETVKQRAIAYVQQLSGASEE